MCLLLLCVAVRRRVLTRLATFDVFALTLRRHTPPGGCPALFHRYFEQILNIKIPTKPCLATFGVFTLTLRRSSPAGAYPLSDVRRVYSYFASPLTTAGSAASQYASGGSPVPAGAYPLRILQLSA